MRFGRKPLEPTVAPARLLIMGLMAILFIALSSCAPAQGIPVESPEWRGLWVSAKSITTPEMIDDVLQRVEAGGFNSIFVNVFYDGQALYDSTLVEKYDKVDNGFDPLAYLVPQAHQRGIQVHAWFVVGRIDEPDSPIFHTHPDWSLVGPDGGTLPWLNLVHSDVQGFISDLMMETVERYGIDGIHFDYTRYPGSEWGFDLHTIREFTEEYGIDLSQLRYADLPAYGLFDGNPLTHPGSAEVLARFENGIPAVVINQYGEGESILLNWKANQRTVAVASEIMQRGLQRLVDGGQVHVLRSETNADEYGYDSIDETMAWLTYLGWEPVETSEAEVARLENGSVLVLPNVYLISTETASHLAGFVQRGGGVIFIDGPTKSIHLREIQALTGMRSRGIYYRGNMLMTSSVRHDLIPLSERNANLKSYRKWDATWREFRMRGISNLIRDIKERVKAQHPDVMISVTITSDQDEARERFLQDWQTWLEDGYVDLLIPRGYVDGVNELESALDAWQPVIREHSPKIVFGVIAYTEEEAVPASKPPEQLLTEIRMTLDSGSNGFMIFDLGRMSDNQLSVFNSFISSLPVGKENLPGSQSQ
jgi:uncharacterized lipoprotein YddW (UPF0748 family)